MKQLTTKQKLDFVKWALEEVCEGEYACHDAKDFYVCNQLNQFFDTDEFAFVPEHVFPELLKFSSDESEICFWEYNVPSSGLQDNQVRAIILSFLYNELTEKLKRERP